MDKKEKEKRDEAERGNYARAVVANPAFIHALEEYERLLFRQFAALAPDDAENQKNLVLMLKLYKGFQDVLNKLIRDGAAADEQVKKALNPRLGAPL